MTRHDAGLAYIKAFPRTTKLTATIEEVVGHTDLAYVRGTYAIDFTAPDGSAAHDKGTYWRSIESRAMVVGRIHG